MLQVAETNVFLCSQGMRRRRWVEGCLRPRSLREQRVTTAQAVAVMVNTLTVPWRHLLSELELSVKCSYSV